jgi:predicted dehydrogenase
MDLGCHGIAFCWWLLGKPNVKSVYAQLATQVHANRTQGDDEALTIIEFDGGAIGVVENSWTKPGGMDDAIEVFGSHGETYADMLMGNALPTYSEVGYGYAVEKAASTKGWSWPVFEEHWNYGFPQEMRHFARCVRGKETPLSDGETGRVVSIREVAVRGQSSGVSDGTLIGGGVGMAGGAAIDLWRKPTPRVVHEGGR